jgi:glucosamine-6-phosphate deaminase
MRVILAEDDAGVGEAAADLMLAAIDAEPDLVVVPATGDTPMGSYARLAALRQERDINTTRLRVFQLDEYLGLAPADHRLLFAWMDRAFVAPLGVTSERVVRFDSAASDPAVSCRAWDAALAEAGGIGLAVLGLGPNGHLGFNEPPSGPDAPTRAVELTPESVRANGAYWGGEEHVPRRALTSGLIHLLAARRVILLVTGEHKHGILQRTLFGDPSANVPASWLQTIPQATVVVDRAAWGPLPLPDNSIVDAR